MGGDGQSKPLGAIELLGASITEASGYAGKRHCFKLDCPKRTFYIHADSKEEMDSWMSELTKFSTSTSSSSPSLSPSASGQGVVSGSPVRPNSSLSNWTA